MADDQGPKDASPAHPDDPAWPQLYQVVGSILRDVAQARYMSDLYSRQISHAYEGDSLLRRFPVPRVDIEQVEFDLKLAVTDVRVDEWRRESRDAAIARIFDAHSTTIIRSVVARARNALKSKADRTDGKRLLEAFEKKFISDDRLDTLRGRLLRFLNDKTGELMDGVKLDTDKIRVEVHQEFVDFGEEPDMVAIIDKLTPPDPALANNPEADARARAEKRQRDWEAVWEQAIKDVPDPTVEEPGIGQLLGKLANEVERAWNKYPDYAVRVEVAASKLQTIKDTALSRITVRAAVRNYRWSKVDVDSKDMRNLRTLNPE